MDLYNLSQDTELDESDKCTRAVGIVYDMTDKQVEELPLSEYNSRVHEAGRFLLEKVPQIKPKRTIKAGNHKFTICYEPSKLRQRQFVEIMHFGKNPIANMNLVLASLVKPVKFGIATKNNAKDHDRISEQLLQAKVTDVFPACVFFCSLYKNLMISGRDFLVKEMLKAKMTEQEANELIMASINSMDGFSTQ